MTDQSQLDQHLDALGAQLDGAAARTERRRSRLWNGLAATAVVVAVGLGALVALPGGERLDPVDRARAALAEDGGILHWVSAFDFIGPNQPEQDFDRSHPSNGTEVWTATSGQNRWRMRTADVSRFQSCGAAVFLNSTRQPVVSLVSPTEFSHGPKVMATYSPWSRAMVVQALSDEADARFDGPPMLPNALGGAEPRDVVRAIRDALERGQLLDRGDVERYGRTVRKLVGTVPQQLPKRPNSETPIKVANPDQLTYFVDANTFAPVELRVRRYAVWSRAGGYKHWKWTTSIDHFLRFERLADTPANRALLEIPTPSGTKVTRLGPNDDQDRLAKRLRTFKQEEAAVKRCEEARDAAPTRP